MLSNGAPAPRWGHAREEGALAKILAIMMRELGVNAAQIDKRLPRSKMVACSCGTAAVLFDAFIADDDTDEDIELS